LPRPGGRSGAPAHPSSIPPRARPRHRGAGPRVGHGRAGARACLRWPGGGRMGPADPTGGAPGPAAADDAVAAALRAVDRRSFLPRAQRRWAGQDRPLAIGHGQTNSQPSTVAAMLRLLDVRPGARVLDVGSGSGWTTALLAVLVGPEGSVLGVERDPDLAA